MRQTQLFASILTFSALVLGASNAQAYSHGGSKWRRSNRNQSFKVNPNDAPAGFENSVRAAAQTWNSQNQIDFQFQYQGQTSVAKSSYRDVQSVYYDKAGKGMDSTTLAVTKHWSQGSEMVHFDIVFNGRQNWSSQPSGGQLDIESVALHEFGHALGLDHSAQWSAVMYRSISNNTRRRALTGDDIAGAAALYPSSNNAGAAPPRAVALVAPKNVINQQRPLFQWRTSANASFYSLELDLIGGSGGQQSVLRINNINKTEYMPGSNLATGENYRWRVVAHSASGLTSVSKNATFSIRGQKLTRPIQVSPIKQTITNRRPTMKWRAVPGAVSYQIWVNQANGKNGILKARVNGTQYKAQKKLPVGSYYYWWVKAIKRSGNSEWSGSYFFIKRK